MKILRHTWIIILLAFLTTSYGSNSPSTTPPNVILCMADDLGWGDVGYNGHEVIRTPHLDALAGEGIRFNHFYAGSSVCSPTRGSVLTGRHPYRYGIYTANTGHLKKEELNLAELLAARGYRTGHFGKWHLGTLAADYSGKKGRRPEENHMTPSMAGFQEWFSTEYAVATYDPYSMANRHDKVQDPRTLYWQNGQNITEGLEGCDSEIIMDRAIPFIRGAVKDQSPFFAVIWFHAPHEPIVGHPLYMEKYYSDKTEEEQHYFSVVTALDAQMGRLVDELTELGVEKNTVLCFTSDNGPEGNPERVGRRQGSAGPFRGRKRSLYDGGIRVPSLIRYPERFSQAREIDIPCVTSDYFPTICELAGIRVDEPVGPVDGISLVDIMEGKQLQRQHPIGFQFGKQQCLVDDRYKLVHNLDSLRPRSDNGEVPVERYELYDLVSDPGETRNLADDLPDETHRLRLLLEEWVSSCERSNAGEDY